MFWWTYLNRQNIGFDEKENIYFSSGNVLKLKWLLHLPQSMFSKYFRFLHFQGEDTPTVEIRASIVTFFFFLTVVNTNRSIWQIGSWNHWPAWATIYSVREIMNGQRNLAGYSPWGHEELDTTQQLSTNAWSSLNSIPMKGRGRE